MDKTLTAACTKTGYKLRTYSDGPWYPVYILANEFGPTWAIQAEHESSAFEIMVDETASLTDASDILEAYGFWLDTRTHTLHDEVNDGCAFPGVASAESALEIVNEVYPERDLMEGHYYQGNFDEGSGIVNLGDYWHFASAQDIVLILETED